MTFQYPVYPLLLAGGSGTRLWPVSRELHPKQLVKFIGKESLIQSTIKRLSPLIDPANIRIVCGQEHMHEIARHMEEIGVAAAGKIICEPCGRNTAPAILLGLLTIVKQVPDAVICVFPADHVIADLSAFHAKLAAAIKLAESNYIVTFGIKPHYPETGYGYIEGEGNLPEDALKIKRFVEKPDVKTAEHYLHSGKFFWNSGMFAFRASTMLTEIRTHAPELLQAMTAMLEEQEQISAAAYAGLRNVSIDTAVMENTVQGAVLPSDFGWSDIGSWKSLYDFLPKDENHNVADGDVILQDSHHCFVLGYERLIATNRVHNLVVVETPDSVFVSDMDSSREVKTIVQELKDRGRWQYQKHRTVYHPWGTFSIVDMNDVFRIAKVNIYPQKTFEVKSTSGVLRQLTVLQGLAQVSDAGTARELKAGDTLALAPKQTLTVNNLNDSPLQLLDLKLMVS